MANVYNAADGRSNITGASTGERVAGQGRLPSFFIVGPPRTGTSWLYEILRPHASLPAVSKEIRFFDKHFHRGLKWYLAHYKNDAAAGPMGEIAPTYFASPEARERIAAIVPESRIVCIFRNPVERIISLYRLKLAYGMIRSKIEDAIEHDPEFMATSRYAGHLKLWQKSFGTERVMVGLYDDLHDNPQDFVGAVADFVGIPRFSVSQEQSGFVHNSDGMTHPRSHFRARTALMVADWFKSRQLDRLVVEFKRSRLRKLVHGGGPSFEAIKPELTKRLYERFRPEVESLEAMLQRDLSSWKAPKRSSEESE